MEELQRNSGSESKYCFVTLALSLWSLQISVAAVSLPCSVLILSSDRSGWFVEGKSSN